MATQPIDPIEEHIAQAMADPKFVASLEEIEAADERGELETVSDEELGDKQPSFIKGCPAEWYELPEPAVSLVVSLDGGYVHDRSEIRRKDGSFEIIVGKSPTGNVAITRFGLVSGYDPKPKRRLFEVLQAQGLQMNQALTFLTDGGETVVISPKVTVHSLFIF